MHLLGKKRTKTAIRPRILEAYQAEIGLPQAVSVLPMVASAIALGLFLAFALMAGFDVLMRLGLF